jgi:hypothetical protein
MTTPFQNDEFFGAIHGTYEALQDKDFRNQLISSILILCVVWILVSLRIYTRVTITQLGKDDVFCIPAAVRPQKQTTRH